MSAGPPSGPGGRDLLHARGSDSRRIAAGLVVLAVVSIALLNLGLYGASRSHLERQRWEQLAGTTEVKREQVREALWQFEHQSRYVAEQPRLGELALAAAHRTIGPGDRELLRNELERAATGFRFHSLQIVDRDGRIAASSFGNGRAVGILEPAEIERAAASERGTLGGIHREPDGVLVVTALIPIADASGRVDALLVAQASLDDLVALVLTSWPGFGPSTGAYLVRADGHSVLHLTAPPASPDLEAGTRATGSAPWMRAAAMAGAGIEASSETVSRSGRVVWTVTRHLPELGWGLVGQADRGEMLQPLRTTVLGLLVLDSAMVIIGVAALWFWRRQYRSGLARRESEITARHARRTQAIFDTAFDAILTFDRGGHITSVNRAAEKLFGRTAAEMEGHPLQRVLRWGAVPRHRGAELPPPGSVVSSEALRGDGTVVPVEFSLGSAGEGEDEIYVAIARDITDRVEAERRIHAFAEGLEQSNRRLAELNAQLEEASRLKSEFLANTSHELRTPLNGMIGFLQLVLDGLCDSPEEERDYQRQALQCSRHLLGLINDVLDIAKIEAGKLTLEVERVDIRQLFDEVYTVTHVQAAQRGLTIEFVPPEDAAVRVRGDFGKIKQVLINLVGNSLKFTHQGSITVSAHSREELGHVLFEVADTGIGIPLDRQQVIFEKFTQGDGSTTRKYGGTGLGLAITRSLIELMGGIIGVRSPGEGHGTRMYFSIPVWRDAVEEPEAEAETETASERIDGPTGGSLVLVVEDDPTFRRFVTAVLHRHGYRTVEARHAESAWVLARRLRPAVVVLDYALSCPEGASVRTGWDLAQKLTGEEETRHIPIVFVTGFDEELKEKLRSTAFARHPEHLVKPVDASALLAKIDELVQATGDRVVRILMADDDPAVAAFIRKVLPEKRFHLEIATDGEECLHAIRTQPRGFDLLLLDLMMPRVSGYDVLREMTLAGLGVELPVLVLTNFPEPRTDEERRLLDEGLVLDVLAKTAVHDNPQLLPHILDWHMQVIVEDGNGAPTAGPHPAEAA